MGWWMVGNGNGGMGWWEMVGWWVVYLSLFFGPTSIDVSLNRGGKELLNISPSNMRLLRLRGGFFQPYLIFSGFLFVLFLRKNIHENLDFPFQALMLEGGSFFLENWCHFQV